MITHTIASKKTWKRTLARPLERLRERGGELFLDGDRIRYRIPNTPNRVRREIRRNRISVPEMLRQQAIKPPSIEEVKGALPPNVKLVSYQPKEAPFAVAPVSIVTSAGKFYRAYLANLSHRLADSEGYSCPPLGDILAKLADAGLELRIVGL